jgi:hypothetical protein
MFLLMSVDGKIRSYVDLEMAVKAVKYRDVFISEAERPSAQSGGE